MSKILFWVGVILVLLLVSRLLGRAAARRREGSQPRQSRHAPPRRSQAMVQCAHCGVHLPASEAVRTQGLAWCSAEHARLGQRPPTA